MLPKSEYEGKIKCAWWRIHETNINGNMKNSKYPQGFYQIEVSTYSFGVIVILAVLGMIGGCRGGEAHLISPRL